MTEILDESAVSEIEAMDHAEMCGDALYCNCGKVIRDQLCATVKHLRAEAKSKKIELLQLSGRGELLAKEHVKFDSLDEVAAVRNELDRLRNVFIPELQQHSERLTTGLINIYHVITNEQCERHVALGMATSAVSSLQSQLEQLRAENERLEKVIALWFGPNSCSVCGGAPLASGKPCVCGGKGTMQAEHEGLRQALYDADISGTKIQQERDSLRGTVSALNNCRNKPVCGHCNALLREAMKSQGEM